MPTIIGTPLHEPIIDHGPGFMIDAFLGEDRRMSDEVLSRRAVSEAVGDAGWRYVLAALRTQVRVPTLARAAEVAAHLAASAGDDADERLRMDLRDDRLLLTIQTRRAARFTAREVALAREISSAVTGLGLCTEPVTGSGRSVQAVEIAIDALDIAAVRPFWKAVLGYTGEAGKDGPTDALVDPHGQAPAVWFQQMDAPRPQRNRIHLDVSVPHDQARDRIAAALAAGGRLVSDAHAPAFWVLADPEGNEACVTTWEGRDP
jgi:4a-hydroxytetrahydrobiopterin dehydratase